MRAEARERSRGAAVCRCAAVVAAVLLVMGVGVIRAAVRAEDRQVHVLPLAARAPLSLELTNGRVSIVGRARSDVRVEIVRRAPTAAALDRLPVAIAADAGALRLSMLQSGGATDVDLTSDVTLEVPMDAVVDAVRIGEGALDVRDLRGRLTAVVRRGPITAAQIAGAVRLETTIGDIEVKGARLVPGGLLRLRTFNGDARLSLAERPTDARVLALALNGTIKSSIPLTVKDKWGPRWGEATLGAGEPVISIDVITGAIVIDAPAAAR